MASPKLAGYCRNGFGAAGRRDANAIDRPGPFANLPTSLVSAATATTPRTAAATRAAHANCAAATRTAAATRAAHANCAATARAAPDGPRSGRSRATPRATLCRRPANLLVRSRAAWPRWPRSVGSRSTRPRRRVNISIRPVLDVLCCSFGTDIASTLHSAPVHSAPGCDPPQAMLRGCEQPLDSQQLLRSY